MERFHARIQVGENCVAIAPNVGGLSFPSIAAATKALEKKARGVRGNVNVRGIIYPWDMLWQDRESWDWQRVYTIAL